MASASLISAPTAALQRSPCLKGEIRYFACEVCFAGPGWAATECDRQLRNSAADAVLALAVTRTPRSARRQSTVAVRCEVSS